MPSRTAGCSLPSNCRLTRTRGNGTCMPIAAKLSSCSSSASSKPVTSKSAPPKAWRAPAPLSSPAGGSIKCSFWTTIGIIDLSLTSRRSSMKDGGALLPELRADFTYFRDSGQDQDLDMEPTGGPGNRGPYEVDIDHNLFERL